MRKHISPTMTKLRLKVGDLRRFLDANMGVMLLLAIVFFGSAILNFQEDNQALLDGQLEQRTGRLAAVEDIAKVNKDNTEEILERVERVERLTCGILLLHDPELTRQLSAELVDLCESELIDRSDTSGNTFSSEDSHTEHQSQPQTNNQPEPQSNQEQPSNPPQNNPDDEMNPLESLLDIISSPFRNIL